MAEKLICDIYRSSRKQDLYLYVDASEGLDRVPPELIDQFGEPEKSFSFVLTEDKQLVREDAATVIRSIRDKGFHLQLPPAEDQFNG